MSGHPVFRMRHYEKHVHVWGGFESGQGGPISLQQFGFADPSEDRSISPSGGNLHQRTGHWAVPLLLLPLPGQRASPVGYCAARNCKGHSSKEAAREHYRQYLIDRFAHFYGNLAAASACVVCGQPTIHYASLDFHYEWEIVPLCAAHLNRD